jgi:uncharacterized protein (TIGR00290 family)
MSGTTPVLMCWSGGKDSCVALHALQRSPDHEVVGLLTTVTQDYGRISMHGVRTELLDPQAAALGLPVERVEIPAAGSNDTYEAAMAAALARYRAKGVSTVAFGDLFLADIRAYRERMLAPAGFAALFPVWGRETGAFARDFIAAGFQAIVTCVDLSQLDASFAGRVIDAQFLADLPPGVDPCGENGEFHSFVFDGPNFARRVAFEVGESVEREGFCFRDLVPANVDS